MIRSVALLLTVLTGFSGLVYEVAWQRYLAVLLGSHGEATAAVLGIFLGGLSLGYSLFAKLCGWLERRVASPSLLAVYGVVEGSIGLYALAFPALFEAARAVSALGPQDAAGAGFAFDVVLSALLILPPTVLMGGTIPILTQALAGSLEDSTRVHALVYASNTAGAFSGALCAGFLLIPWLGLRDVILAMGALNLAAGASFLALGVARRERPPAPEAAPAPSVPGFASFAAAALLAGFAMMCLQTVLMRVGALSFGASQFTFATVVAVFVFCIALGSFAVSVLPRVRPEYVVGTQWALVLCLLLLYPQVADAPFWAHWLRTKFGVVEGDFLPYYGSVFGALLGVLALPIGLSGALLPLLFHVLRQRVGELGTVAGSLYSWNTVGSTLGALLGGYALLFWLDLHQIYRLAVAALAVGSALVALRLLDRWRGRLSAIAAGALVLGLGSLPAWSPGRLAAGLFRHRVEQPWTRAGPDAFDRATRTTNALRFHDDDPVSTVTVWDFAEPGKPMVRAVFVNGKSDGAVPGDYITMSMAALLPALFAERCERSFVIGYGTGVTVGELAALDCSRQVDVAEISSGVIEAAPLFDGDNQGASRSPKVRVVQGDAYRTLVRSSTSYDVIASEPSNPWVTGVEMLYSREFLELARSRLAPGGVYAQWVHTYDLDTETLALVFRTYDAVFDHVAIWYTNRGDLILLGLPEEPAALDLARLEARAAQPDFAAALQRSEIQGLPALLAHELLPVGVLRAAQLTGPIHTLLHPVLSDRAARAFFVGLDPESYPLPRTSTPGAAALGAQNSLLRRVQQHLSGESLDRFRAAAVSETCRWVERLCAPMLAEWSARDPGSPALRAILEPLEKRSDWPRSQALLAELVELYRNGSRATATAPVRLTPERASALVEQYYHHAVPMQRETPGAPGTH